MFHAHLLCEYTWTLCKKFRSYYKVHLVAHSFSHGVLNVISSFHSILKVTFQKVYLILKGKCDDFFYPGWPVQHNFESFLVGLLLRKQIIEHCVKQMLFFSHTIPN